MEVAMDSVAEDGGTIEVCAEIVALPAGGLGTDMVVMLSTSNADGKAGLQYCHSTRFDSWFPGHSSLDPVLTVHFSNGKSVLMHSITSIYYFVTSVVDLR